jgi:hypothetical protein
LVTGNGKWMRGKRFPGEASKDYSVSVNMLCIIGATIGVFSLFLPWIWWAEGAWQDDGSVYDVLFAPHDGRTGWWESMITVSHIVFICGTILAFIFPAACGIQATGIGLFYVEYLRTDTWIYDRGLSIGSFVAVASTVLVIAGLTAPWGTGFDAPHKRWSRRIWTVYRMRRGDAHKSKQSLASPLDVLHALSKDRKLATALVVIILLMSVAVLYTGEIDGAGSVEYEDGRIAVSMGNSATLAYWGMITLRVSDESETVEWDLESSYDEYVYGEWLPPTLDAKNLSGLSIVPVVVDYGGEGGVTGGDRVILSPQNGTSFDENIEYRVAILEVPWVTDVSHMDLHVSFKLVDDDVHYEFERVLIGGWLTTERPYYVAAYCAVIIFVLLSAVAYGALVGSIQRRGA